LRCANRTTSTVNLTSTSESSNNFSSQGMSGNPTMVKR